jgi:hypothetical protein
VSFSFLEIAKMIAVRGIYDGQQVQLLEPVPIATRTPVVVTFLTDDSALQYPASADTQPDLISELRGSTRTLHLRERLLEYRTEERERERAH